MSLWKSRQVGSQVKDRSRGEVRRPSATRRVAGGRGGARRLVSDETGRNRRQFIATGPNHSCSGHVASLGSVPSWASLADFPLTRRVVRRSPSGVNPVSS